MHWLVEGFQAAPLQSVLAMVVTFVVMMLLVRVMLLIMHVQGDDYDGGNGDNDDSGWLKASQLLLFDWCWRFAGLKMV